MRWSSGGQSAHSLLAPNRPSRDAERPDFTYAFLDEELMRTLRLTRASLFASVALLPLAANAQERNLFTWSGTVDREVVIQIRGRDIETHGSGLDASMSPRVNLAQPLPRTPGVLRVRVENGRGEVAVLENPSPRNNYTAVLRVRDTQGGSDRYRILTTFEPENGYYGDRGNDNRNGNGDYDRGNNGRGRGRDNNDRNGYPNNGNPNNGYPNNGYPNNGYPNDRNDRNGRNDNSDYDRNRADAGALRWSGVVDGVTESRIQGNRVDLTSRGQEPRNVRYDIVGASLPRRDTQLEVSRSSGRGIVRVVQQPSRFNGYTAVIRVEDSAAGASGYDFAVRW